MPGRKSKKRTEAPAQTSGWLRQTVAAEFCGVTPASLRRASRLWDKSLGRYGLRYKKCGRLALYSAADLSAWIEAGMPTGYHRDDDGKIRQVEFA